MDEADDCDLTHTCILLRDYTREAGQGIEWYNSDIFDDKFFGPNNPNNEDHVVDSGRDERIAAKRHARVTLC
jgi:hypothetical protein